jgi:hypothetical protein
VNTRTTAHRGGPRHATRTRGRRTAAVVVLITGLIAAYIATEPTRHPEASRTWAPVLVAATTATYPITCGDWQAATWGKARICTQAGDWWAQAADTRTDGYCVSVRRTSDGATIVRALAQIATARVLHLEDHQ